MISKVRKRDGRIVAFNEHKITKAMLYSILALTYFVGRKPLK